MPETYTGNEGTDALAGGYAVMDGTEDRRNGWLAINKTRDYLAKLKAQVAGLQLTWGAITGKPSTFPPSAHSHAANTIPTTGSNVQTDIDYLAGNIQQADRDIDYLNDIKLDKAGGTVSGNLHLPNASAATSAYTVAYINGDGRVSKGASSERYKKYISAIDPTALGDVWPDLHRFQMRQGDGTWKYGYIAERLAESEDLLPFVVYDADGRPDSIDFIALLMVQNAQLHHAVDLLAQRLDALERA